MYIDIACSFTIKTEISMTETSIKMTDETGQPATSAEEVQQSEQETSPPGGAIPSEEQPSGDVDPHDPFQASPQPPVEGQEEPGQPAPSEPESDPATPPPAPPQEDQDAAYREQQARADRAEARAKKLEDQLAEGMTPEQREQLNREHATSELQAELVDTQLSSGYWTKEFPDLGHLSKERLESVVRNAYQAHPGNRQAVRDTIRQTAEGAGEIARSVENVVQPQTAPDDQPAQAPVTPKPNYENMSEAEVNKHLKAMPFDALQGLFKSTFRRDKQ